MKKCFAIVGLVAGLAACTPAQVPDSGAGVGFNDYADFELERARREAALNGIGPGGTRLPTSQAIPTSELQAAGIGQTGAPLSAINPPQTQTQTQSQTTPATQIASGAAPASVQPTISDENDFGAVSSRETIESDAQRLQQVAAAREEVQPTALPTRPSNTGPNIVAYALNAPNRLGQEWYSRSLLSGQSRFQRNCAGYNTPDAAQRDFLQRGGPERDPRGIDPDGDGFACGWDPAPFLLAAGR